MTTIRFTVLGHPEPAGSKRAFVNPRTGKTIITDANAKARPWKALVADAATQAGLGGELLTGPLSLRVVFVLARPKGHYRTGRNAHLLRDAAPAYPTGKPDALKLTRGTEDALTGIAWRDDAQIVEQYVSKVYGAPERCEITIDDLASAVLDRRAA